MDHRRWVRDGKLKTCWYVDEHCANANDAILVFFANRVGCSIGEAYVYTDGWAKRRNATDEDGKYWSYN